MKKLPQHKKKQNMYKTIFYIPNVSEKIQKEVKQFIINTLIKPNKSIFKLICLDKEPMHPLTTGICKIKYHKNRKDEPT